MTEPQIRPAIIPPAREYDRVLPMRADIVLSWKWASAAGVSSARKKLNLRSARQKNKVANIKGNDLRDALRVGKTSDKIASATISNEGSFSPSLNFPFPDSF